MKIAPAGRALIAALALSLQTAALAGGPNYIYDYTNRIPYAWNMSSWPNGVVPIYTDLGTLGRLSNAQADDLVVNAAWQWSSVPFSTFRGAVAGDFAALGLGDVTSINAASIIGTFNGGGIHIIYDNDGSVLEDYFGAPATSVLGITEIEAAAADSPEILEAWMVLSGPGVRAIDPSGVGFAGVVTHEMGHALNLAHTQLNGGTQPNTFLDPPQPPGCGAPWTGAPDATQVETMYPFITPEPFSTGEYMATVNQLDDKAAVADIYPAPGWPANRGTIRGQILNSDGTPITGINVIARNIADPFGDCTSYISGQVSRGNAGPDGSFVMNGLRPGASYVLYVDQLMNGAFPVPTLVVMPGPEEYFNGPMESGDGSTDDRCAWSPVAATAGAPVTIDIRFNKVPGAPTFIPAPIRDTDGNYTQSIPYDITADGGVIVGEAGFGGRVFHWDVNANTFERLPNPGFVAGGVAISDDGLKITANIIDAGINKAAIYENNVWTALPPFPGSVPCALDGPPTQSYAYDLSGDGSTVVGMAYGNMGCDQLTLRAFKWTAADGYVTLNKIDAPTRMNRANAVNYDGSVIVGRDDANNGQLRGFQWRNGVYSLIKRNNLPVGEALGVSRDGQYIVGHSNTASTNAQPWLWSQPSGVQLLGATLGQDGGLAGTVCDDGSVITGYSLDFDTSTLTPTIWTSGLGLTDLNQFLSAQGVSTAGLGLYLGMAMSSNCQTITGYAASPIGYLGWVLKTPTSVVCHTPAGSPTQLQTTIVSFPHGLDAALASGDTLGVCQCNASAPTGSPQLLAAKPAAGTAHLVWSAVAGATGYDLTRGSLSVLKSSHGNFTAATTGCLENDLTATSRDDADTPDAGDGFWYLVRAVNCGGSATFDSGTPSQVASRDAGIQASPEACP